MDPGHPAIRAWRELRPRGKAPKRIEVLKEDPRNAAVYRLVSSDFAYKNIIAKRSPQEVAGIERAVYEEILPELPLPMLEYYGFVQELDARFCWLFTEDLSSDEMYNPRLKEHQVAAALWLGLMNISASNLEEATRLPERGPQHYRNLLHSARDTIRSYIANPVVVADQRALLRAILAQCNTLLAHWGRLASVCVGMPNTLVHGDFIKNNVRVRRSPAEIVVLPFDWEKAGWGSPAEDISKVDISTYWSAIKNHWPNLSNETLKRIVNVGKVFRCIVFLDWIVPRLAYIALEQPIRHLRDCENWLAELIPAVTEWD